MTPQELLTLLHTAEKLKDTIVTPPAAAKKASPNTAGV